MSVHELQPGAIRFVESRHIEDDDFPILPPWVPGGILRHGVQSQSVKKSVCPAQSLSRIFTKSIQSSLSPISELRKMNDDLPIMKSPAEVLCNIFLFVQPFPVFTINNQYTGASVLWNTQEPHHQWTKVLRVCQRWREVALSCAALWTTVILNEELSETAARLSLEYPAMMLQNSEDHLLDMNYTTSRADDLSSSSQSTFFSEMRRTRHLVLSGDAPWRLRFPEPMSAPHLRTLVIDTTTGRDPTEEQEMPRLFHDLSSVRSLAITAYNLYPTMSLIQLRQLYLRDVHITDPQNLRSLLLLLQSAPDLEDLSFSSVFVDPSAVGNEDVYSSVDLHKLKRLIFNRTRASPELLLPFLRLPAGVRLAIKSDLLSNELVELAPPILPADRSALGELYSFDQAIVNLSDFGRTNVIASRGTSTFHAEWTCHDLDGGCDSIFNLLFHSGSAMEKLWIMGPDPQRIAGSLCRKLRGTKLKTLALNIGNASRSLANCIDIIAEGTSLREICLPCPRVTDCYNLSRVLRRFNVGGSKVLDKLILVQPLDEKPRGSEGAQLTRPAPTGDLEEVVQALEVRQGFPKFSFPLSAIQPSDANWDWTWPEYDGLPRFCEDLISDYSA